MPTSEDARAWLAHSGVLGMHWGVRKSKISPPRQPKKVLTAKEKEMRKAHIIDAVAAAGTLGVGLYAYKREIRSAPLLAKKLLWTIALKRAAKRGAQASAPVIKKLGPKPIYSMVQDTNGIWRIKE